MASRRGTKKGEIGLRKRMKGFDFLHVILSPKMLYWHERLRAHIRANYSVIFFLVKKKNVIFF